MNRKLILPSFLIIIFTLCIRVSANYASDIQVTKERLSTELDIRKAFTYLETKMSDIHTLDSDFTQIKELAMFKDKIVMEGKLFIQKPAHLAWHVYKPVRYTAIIDGDIIKQWDEETGQVRSISLAKNPSFGIIVAQMQMWFLGEFTGFLNNYDVKIRQMNPYIIDFIPKSETIIASIIDNIKITFKEDEQYIYQIHIQEKNGDSTRLTFSNTRINSQIDPIEWEVKSHVR